MEFLILLALLQLKHYFADFQIQSYQQVLSKGIYGNLVGVSHTFEHAISTLIVLLGFNFIHPLTAFDIVFVTVVECLIHYHVDWFKIKFGTKDSQTSLFWQQYGLDQLAHQLTYIWLIYYLLF